MIQISFQLFVILISTDVLREIRRDIAENLGKRRLARVTADNEDRPNERPILQGWSDLTGPVGTESKA
jgi:hypothetical protein